MGAVYLAEQLEPIRRRVALKVVKLGMDTVQVLARFDRERQALAMMDHPNIARIFDAGATRKGRPYFVMEYIEGAPITQYCDRRQMTTRRRLELFLAVCRGVQHAHQKGVIHRDLKPSNVLVMDQDGAAVPKVIDFGIAKATDQWAVENELLTQFGQLVGTPEYASPEQAEVMTGDVGESSDVYSLGVLLYELLSGTVPFDTTSLRRAGLAEMLRIIREEEAPPLSRRLAAMGSAAAGIAVNRNTDPASLRRLVDGDLNRITLKALEKAPARRYASVLELAADIQRHLEHRPVLVSPPGALYRVRKFLRRHRPATFGAASALAVILLSGLTVWSIERRDSRPQPRLTHRSAVVVGDFTNTTGEPAFDGSLRRVLAGELGKSPWFSVLSDARISETLRLMVRAADAKLTPEVASELCERTASAAVVEGSISNLGGAYILGLRARDCRTGDTLDEEQAPAARKEDVFQAVGQLANRFGTRAGGSLAKQQKTPSLRTEVTTPSLEAWRSYSAAMKAAQNRSLGAETRSLLKRAIEIDPKFAMAYTQLGLSAPEMSAQNVAKAYQLRDRVSDWENYYITFNYHRQATGNLELARQTLETWAQRYPDTVEPHGLLSAFTSQALGRYENAVEEGQKSLQLDQDFAMGYVNTAWAYLYQNRLAEAEAMLRKASDRKINNIIELSLCGYLVAFLRNDRAAMERETTYRKEKFESQGRFEHQEAATLAYQGRLKEAAQLSDIAVTLARQGNFIERAALFQGSRAVWNALYGLRAEAQTNAAAALSIHRSRDADYGPAFALAMAHGTGKPEDSMIEADLEKRYPDYTSARFSYLPVLRALEALNNNDPVKALETTRAAAPYELGVPGTAFYSGAFFGALYPIYVRGLALSRMGRHREAATEFQKIVDHPGPTQNDPIGPMARLQLARALSASGDRAGSAAIYQNLITLWKNADPDLPAVQEANAEFKKQ